MRALALSLVLVLAACEIATGPREPVEYRPEEAGTVDHAMCLLGFTAVPLARAATTGHHLVEARLNGRDGLFVLDTGANLSVVDDNHVETFGLSGRRARPGGGFAIGGTVAAQQVAIDSLELDGVPIRQRQMVVADLGHLTAAMRPLAGGAVHGLIGQDALNEHRAVIDMERPILYVMEADRDPAPVPAERCRAEGDDAAANASGNP